MTTLQDLLPDNAAEILAQAVNHPAVRKMPNPDQMGKAVLNAIEHEAMRVLSERVMAEAEEALSTLVLLNGEREDAGEGLSDWDSGLDDVSERLAEPYHEHLSADWLGKNTIDAHLHEVGVPAKWASSLAREWYKQYTRNADPNVLLAEVQIGPEDIKATLQANNAPRGQAAQEEGFVTPELAETIQALFTACGGPEYDPISTYDEIDSASDDDNLLAVGAMQRLVEGIDDTACAFYVSALQDARHAWGDKTPDKLLALFAVLAEGGELQTGAASAPVEVALPSERKQRTSKKKAKKVEEKPANVDASVLSDIKALDGRKDELLAEALGVSRAQVNKWLNGKADFQPTQEQFDTLLGLCKSYMAKGAELYQKLTGQAPDGVELHVTTTAPAPEFDGVAHPELGELAGLLIATDDPLALVLGWLPEDWQAYVKSERGEA